MLGSILQILVSTLTLGGIYAISAIGLALLWGVMGMLNMAQGALMAIGAYACVYAIAQLGVPWVLGLPAAVIIGGICGWLLFFASVRWMLGSSSYETNIIIVTVGFAVAAKSLMIIVFSGYPKRQPFTLDGGFHLAGTMVPYQTVLIVSVTLLLMLVLTAVLNKTRMGLAIRATAQGRRAAALMGVPAERVFLQVMMICGSLAAISGVLVSSIANVSPTLGDDAMLKVFIICVVAGLGNIPGTILVSFLLALVEVTIQYAVAAKWGFPVMLCAAIVTLIWCPAGIFGNERITRN